MNIHEAIDRLEYLIGHSRQIPLTRTVATVKKGVEALRVPAAKAREVEVVSGRS